MTTKQSNTSDNERYNETNGHKISRTLSKYKFYLPSKQNQSSSKLQNHDPFESPRRNNVSEPPSLEKAWNYFEYRCLPRCFTDIIEITNNRKYYRAGPEELDSTKLYPVIDTPINDMADFGVGVALYFQTIRFFGIVSFIAGCLSIPVMMFYSSEDYSKDTTVEGRSFLSRYSAVCTDTKFQPCPSCSKDQWSLFPSSDGRLLFTENGDGNFMAFILVNRCTLNESLGMYSLITLIFVVVSVYIFIYLQKRYMIRLNEQTTSNYSIQIKNPPNTKKARDPSTWKTFFEERFKNLHVTVCTVAYKNEKLINLLMQQHKIKSQLRDLVPTDVKLFDENSLEEILEKCVDPVMPRWVFWRLNSSEKLYRKSVSIQSQIDELLLNEKGKPDFEISSVFVTFETETMKRAVLDALEVPRFREGMVGDDMKFEGKILRLCEPDEPSAIFWNQLHSLQWVRFVRRILTLIMTCLLIVGAGFLIAFARRHSLLLATLAIIGINIMTPSIVRYLSIFESHASESTLVQSSYLKITAIRWVSTAIVTLLITPFTEVLQGGKFIHSLQVLFTAELVQRLIVQPFDWIGNFKRHVMGPRASFQRKMYYLFTPATYDVGERYTEMTKILFLACSYCLVFPCGYFFTSAILFIYYWTDKFSILRSWRQLPRISASISLFSTNFLLFTVVAYAVFIAYLHSSFPFDDACLTDDEVPDNYIGNTYVIKNGLNAGLRFTITSDDGVYQFCNQNVFTQGLKVFPPTPNIFPTMRKWMNTSQESSSILIGWALICISTLVVLSIITRLLIRFIVPLFVQNKVMSKKGTNNVRFSEINEKYGYVPQVQVNGFLHPLLICDISDINNELIGWKYDFESNNLMYAIPKHMRNTCFSKVKYWQPPAIDESWNFGLDCDLSWITQPFFLKSFM